MRNLLLLLLICISYAGFSQSNVVALEYFIDTDPGVGAATPLTPVTAGPSIDQDYVIPVGGLGLAPGLHRVGIRAQDADGDWSMREYRTFNITSSSGTVQNPDPPSPIIAMEYFIDTDPGVGNGTPLPAFPGSDVNLDFPDIIEASTVSAGLHIVCIRGQDSDGQWGMYEKRTFQVRTNGVVQVPAPPEQIVAMEYFIDVDPGVGNGTSLSNFSSPSLNVNYPDIAIANGLGDGIHVICIRAQDSNGDWGHYEKRTFVVRPINVLTGGTISNIVAFEYFFGDDPGAGNGVQIPVDPPVTDYDQNLNWPTAQDIPVGTNTVTVRAKNELGFWSFAETREFEVDDNCTFPNAQFDVLLGCATDTVQFIDTSFDIIPTENPEYRWYFDGDDQVDDTTIGDASWTYDIPGTYKVSLAIYQGQTCSDSVGTNITIKPKPAIAISATGNLTNQPTAFEASTVNLDPAATWSWDFDSDGTPESTNPNTASYTYTADGSYTTTLTVSDGFGCNVTSTKSVTMSSDGAAPPPSVDFLVSDGCAGEPIQFTDLSRNLPTGSTYSWDFDGDGSEDSTTPGLVQFIYAVPNTYTATLTIDIGGSTIQASKIVDVLEVPSVDFSSVKTCAGQATSFTDLSSGINGSAVYMWDFDNDGSVDSNASTAISFVYPAAGNYIARLTINNGAGCQRSIVKQVEVAGAPSSAFSNSISCTNETVAFMDLSSDVNAGASYSWDFDGDGLEDDNIIGDPVFTYNAAGTYDATLTVTNDPGCADVFTKQVVVIDKPLTDINVIARCYGEPSQMIDLSTQVAADATYSWDFDNDKLIDSQAKGSTTFVYPSDSSYVARLLVDNGGGCFAESQELVVFSDKAQPDFDFGTTCQGVEVIFTDLSSQLATGATYSWDFDGNGLADSQFPGSTSFKYSEAGIYYPKLEIDNGANCLATKIDTLEITGPPLVSLGPDVFLCNDSTVVLDAGEGYTSYFWYDDGSSEQTYTIDKIGTYVVNVTDAKSCQNSDTIRVGYLGDPTPSFEYTYQLVAEGMIVNFTNTSINGVTYRWDFGDASPPVFDESPIHLFDEFFFYKNTFYDVCLTVTNACDRPVEYCQTISLSPTELEGDIGNTKIYPNPAKDILSIDFDEIPLRAQLFDAKGRSVWSKDDPDPFTEIRVSEWQAGIYILTLVKEDGLFYRNVVIQ